MVKQREIQQCMGDLPTICSPHRLEKQLIEERTIAPGISLMRGQENEGSLENFFPQASLVAAYAQRRVTLRVAPGVVHAPFFDIAWYLSQEHIAIESLQIIVGAGSHVRIYDTRTQEGTVIRSVECILHAYATLEYVQVVDCPSGHDITGIHVTLNEGACYRGTTVGAGNFIGVWCNGTMSGVGSNFSYTAAIVGEEQQRVCIETRQNQCAPQTCSEVTVRSVLHDDARLYYRGNIMMDAHLAALRAEQQAHILLLGQHAVARAVPALEVLSDDVQCKHGSAVGSLQDEQLEYLCARGIDPAYARRLIINGFLAAPVQGIEDAYKKRFSFFS